MVSSKQKFNEGVDSLLRLALCEDDPIFQKSQQNICEDVLRQIEWEARLTVYSSAEALLADWEKGMHYDILLLDIVMGEMDGITLARRLRSLQAEASIVFITSNPNFAIQGYDVDALHYLMKPLQPEALAEVLQKYMNRNAGECKVCFTIGAKTFCENPKNILYLETKNRNVEIVLKHKKLTIPGKLSDHLAALPAECFLRCHQGFAVNTRQVQEIDGNLARMVNGEVIPIGRTYKKVFRDSFLNLIGQ